MLLIRRRERLLFLIMAGVLLLKSPFIVAQEIHLGCQWGKGAYYMEHLKSFERQLVGEIPGAKQKVADYPPYWFYQPSISINWYRLSLGMAVGIHTTGSRYSLIDYSGEYRFDTRIKGSTFGTVLKFMINPKHPVNISLCSKAGIISSKADMMEYFVVDEQVLIDESVNSRSRNYYLEPGIEISCPIYFVIVAVQAGTFVQFGGNGLHGIYEGQEFEFSDYNGPVKPEWQGYRISGSLTFNLNRLFTKKKQ
jgi:hypothetical protein